MTATDPALTALSQGWCALSLLHGRIEAHIERALQTGHDLSVREYSCSTSSAASTTATGDICR